VKSIKPNFKKLGPKYGKFMKEISSQTNLLKNRRILELEKTGKIDLIINKKSITFNVDDFDISSKDIEGWLVANEGNITVALDISIDQELMEEGIAREIVSKIQNLRKSNGFEVTDRIGLNFSGDFEIEKAINNNLEYVKSETLANAIQFNVQQERGHEIFFDKLKTKIFITKV
jgi:isoleucyl-tRNA synthetase